MCLVAPRAPAATAREAVPTHAPPPAACRLRLAPCSKLRQDEGFLWEREVWAYFLQVALGVQYLHHNHVLHRWAHVGIH